MQIQNNKSIEICWAHVQRAYTKFLSFQSLKKDFVDIRDEIDKDIHMLQLASSIGNYLYEGICPHCPSTNNALETTNNSIKTTHT